jgi:hypothetical protein
VDLTQGEESDTLASALYVTKPELSALFAYILRISGVRASALGEKSS